MIGRVKALLGLEEAGRDVVDPGRELQLAAAVLLVEAATADGVEDAREVLRMKRVLAEHFHLGEAETEELVRRASAISEDAVDWNRFTRVLKQGFEHEERIQMLEMLWVVVLADGDSTPTRTRCAPHRGAALRHRPRARPGPASRTGQP